MADFSTAQVKRDYKRERHGNAVDESQEQPPLPQQPATTLAGFEHIRCFATS